MASVLASSRAGCAPLQALQQQQQPQHVGCPALVPGAWRAASRRRLQRLRAEADERSAATKTGVCREGGGCYGQLSCHWRKAGSCMQHTANAPRAPPRPRLLRSTHPACAPALSSPPAEGGEPPVIVSLDLDLDKEVSKFARSAATTFAPRASGATGKNPAYRGSTLYTVFEVQAWAAAAVSGLLSYNLIFPSDEPNIARLLGCAGRGARGGRAGEREASQRMAPRRPCRPAPPHPTLLPCPALPAAACGGCGCSQSPACARASAQTRRRTRSTYSSWCAALRCAALWGLVWSVVQGGRCRTAGGRDQEARRPGCRSPPPCHRAPLPPPPQAVPLLNVALPFVWKSFPFIFTADCLLMAGVCAWKGLIPGLAAPGGDDAPGGR